MERSTPVEEDILEKLHNDLTDCILNVFKRKYQKLDNNDSKESCHKDVETERQPDGTKFECIYLHKNHVLFLDWLLNHARDYTNMPYSLELASELKKATSTILKRIEKEETESHKDVKTEECQDITKSKLQSLEYFIEKTMEEVGQIKQYLYDKFEKHPNKMSSVFNCHKCGKNCLKIENGFMTWGCAY